MRSVMASFAAIALATAGSAQLVGGGAGVSGAVQGTVGGVGTADGTAGAVVNTPDGPMPDVARPIERGAHDTTRATARAADRTATRTAAAAGKPVKVEAGTSVRVAQGTRCYYDDYYFDPVYRDGYYYCERTGPGAAAGAGVKR